LDVWRLICVFLFFSLEARDMPLPNSWTLDDVLALSLHPQTKARDARSLVERYASLEALLHSAPEELSKARATNGSLFAAAQVDELRRNAAQQRELCAQSGVQTISFWDDEYPALLKEIYYPPTFLFVRGRLQPPDAAAVAIVGTRHCTDYGKMVAEQYAEYCARMGVVMVSGMATGIDAYAHKAVVKSGGVTYAVIASGIDKINPGAARRLADEICERGGGAIISEYPMGTPALPAYFPRRNRIISGIAKGTLVVQSGEKGGSLITAQFALDQNRELFAVPGGIYSERSKGANRLIQRSQAHLTLTPEDMFQTLGFATKTAADASFVAETSELSAVEVGVYKELADGDPIHIEALALKTGLLVQDLLVILLQLELKGKVRQLAGKQFMKRV
jgi:DNA processing protein